MSLFRMRVLPVCLALVFIGLAALTPAQNLPATPHTPDLLGIYPGMPANEARAMLQKHSTTVYVKTGSPPESGFGLAITDPKNPDLINVDLIREPNDPNVWLITRSWVYYPGAGGPGLSQEALLTALRQKYGKETLTWDREAVAYSCIGFSIRVASCRGQPTRRCKVVTATTSSLISARGRRSLPMTSRKPATARFTRSWPV